ncbi:MAG: Fe-S cluster assembly protein SufB, partial [Stellaceae bacterium]
MSDSATEALDPRTIVAEGYKFGFVTDIEEDRAPPGLNEDVIRFISERKREPLWLLEWRLGAYRRWLKLTEPKWAKLRIAPIDYQAASYYSAPKPKST